MQTRIIEKSPELVRKKNVCAYARVSIDKDAMHHSLSAQVSYYSSYIQARKEWNYVGVYSDDAFTGTKEDRPGFQRMLADANEGKIDMIITKSISRFARNTVTLLSTLRSLKEKGIDIYFEEQNIHTLSATGELLITLFASLAQEESRSASENIKWRIKKDFEEGKYWGGADCYGYKIVDREFIVVPEEAELVKRVFKLYIDGLGLQAIANLFNKEGIKPKFSDKWNKGSLQLIINNYNYTGDLILQKTFRENHLTKLTKVNRGEYDRYLVSEHHEPIISKEDFELAQQIREQRIDVYKSRDVTKIRYPYSGLIVCGCCGDKYRHRSTKYRKFWSCETYNRSGKAACASKSVPDDELDRITSTIINDINEANIYIDKIEVQENNTLIYHMKDGRILDFKWADYSRKNSWTPEMKEAARQKTIERNKKNGNSNSNTSKAK